MIGVVVMAGTGSVGGPLTPNAHDIPFADADTPDLDTPQLISSPTPTPIYSTPRPGGWRVVGGGGGLPLYCNTSHHAYTNTNTTRPIPTLTRSTSLPPSHAPPLLRSTSLPPTHSPPNLNVVERAGGAVRVATDRPHLVSMGGGRLSTGVTLHPINEGMTLLGSGGMGVVPDVVVRGTGVEAEHCTLEHRAGVVTITPAAGLVTIDGVRITTTTRLTQEMATDAGLMQIPRGVAILMLVSDVMVHEVVYNV
ncbi:hypothetical protein Pmani_016934 [Petrolisthes manimaculis]|uniref:Uncharacterized protein n=1 Tax=Petrolisthes manimaculis TaxID=1843537 RepID=A0AAE1PR80_9EUCA|nr:hypothetical protein Pmani_016934 [Petrolisthes manimaculis]